MTDRVVFLPVSGLVIARDGALVGLGHQTEIFGIDRFGRYKIWPVVNHQRLHRPQLEIFTDSGFAIVDARAAIATVDGWRKVDSLRVDVLGGAEPAVEHVVFADFNGGFDHLLCTSTCGIGLCHSGRSALFERAIREFLSAGEVGLGRELFELIPVFASIAAKSLSSKITLEYDNGLFPCYVRIVAGAGGSGRLIAVCDAAGSHTVSVQLSKECVAVISGSLVVN